MIFGKHFLFITCFCFIVLSDIKSQVNIMNINVQAFNVVPEALLNVTIMNNGSEQQVQLMTQVFNSANSVLMTVKSEPFMLMKGLNPGIGGTRKVSSIAYASDNQSSYLKTTHNLPSGRFKICASLIIPGGTDKLDDLCEELEAEFNQYLYLVNPNDGDTVDTKNPLLSWTHSEPFTILNQGEFYRMIVTEMKKDQTADIAINVNSPTMVKDYLQLHQLQYPYDAKTLNDGTRYAWQVQKISDGVVINKTEAWVFITKSNDMLKSMKYVALKAQLDGAYYTAYDGKVFFKFSEEYKSSGGLNYILTDSKSKALPIEIVKDRELTKGKSGAATNSTNAPEQAQLKLTGSNRFELDLNKQNLNTGFYTLVVKNEKNESFYLKIFLP